MTQMKSYLTLYVPAMKTIKGYLFTLSYFHPENIVGYKYLDFGDNETSACAKVLVANAPKANSWVDIYLDAPDEAQGGIKIGTISLNAEDFEKSQMCEEAADEK